MEPLYPLYTCHKQVRAIKIEDVIDPTEANNESDGSRILKLNGFTAKRVDHDYVRKHNPTAGGYLVIYEDGYQSFSPASVFEAGYTKA